MSNLPAKPLNSRFNDAQWQAIHERGHNILVSASAGSGKTTVLIERILNHLLTHYAQMDQLLVSTFTEAAANEMKQRMESRLKAAVNQTADRQEQAHLVKQLQLLPRAHIRTLHSFCLQVIQEYFYIIDFDPSFRLLTDETQKSLLYQEVWQGLMNQLAEDDAWSQTVFELLRQFSLGPNDRGLYELVLALHQFASAHPEPTQWLEGLDHLSQDWEGLVQSDLFQKVLLPEWQANLTHAQLLLSQAQGASQGLSDKIQAKIQAILQADSDQVVALIQALAQADLSAIFDQVQAVHFDKWPGGKKGEEDQLILQDLKPLRDQAKELVEGIKQLLPLDYDTSRFIESQAGKTIQALSALTQRFRATLWQAKCDQNCIDYNDLEHLTLDILAPYNPQLKRRCPSEAALYYQALFCEVLVDEYQDINDIQASILSFLSHERSVDRPGNLFMVGDVKQSIYGFRMAEPSLFLAKYQAYQAGDGGQLIVLDANYRSRDEILQFTNFVFERLMDADFGEMPYGLRESLKTGNHHFLPTPPDSDFDLEFLLYEKQAADIESGQTGLAEEEEVETCIEAEAWLIGQDIQRRIAEGWLIYDKEQAQLRPLTYQDVVILSSTRHPFQAVKEVFDQLGIPLLSQKVENYFQRQEIRLMLALLKLLDNPLQDIPLVAILRSQFVGLSDEDLSQIRILTPQGSFYEACLHFVTQAPSDFQDLQTQLQGFLTKLQEWRDLSRQVDLITLIWTLYQDTYFLDYVAGLDQGHQRQANLHAFYERVVEFEVGNYKGLTAFVQFIEQIMAHDQDLAEPLLLSEEQNYVRIMTVHASKGLEFPFVYLMNTGKGFNIQDTQKVYVPSKRYGLGLDYLDSQHQLQYPSLIKEIIKLERRNQLKAEEMRKLYVALTRCEQKLVIVGTIKNREKVEEDAEKVRQATGSELVMNRSLRQSAKGWLDWMLMAVAFSGRHQDSTTTFSTDQTRIHYVAELGIGGTQGLAAQRPLASNVQGDAWLSQLQVELEGHEVSTPIGAFIKQLLEAQYDYTLASRTSSYQSVSELKRLYEEPQNDKLSHYQDRRLSSSNLQKEESPETAQVQSIRYTGDTFQPPAFIRQTQDYNAAQRGTFTHYVMQQLDFAAFQGQATTDYAALIESQVQDWIDRGQMRADQWQAVKRNQLVHFLASDLGQMLIASADLLRREKPFSYRLPAQRLFKQQLSASQLAQLADSQLLIHGVVDNYLQLPDGRLILIDYKTDHYRPWASQTKADQVQAVVDKYRFQMSLYARALSLAVGQPVSAVYLVLLDFETVECVENLYEF